MSEKEQKPKPTQSQLKNIPKDGQVILSIMREMGITEYEPKTLVQLTEFVYRYVTSVLDEARAYANSKKKFVELDDVRLALELSSESSFTTPPSREIVMECARNKNSSPLPLIKPHFGMRLPPDRHCLASCNYSLRTSHQKKHQQQQRAAYGSPALKISNKPGLSYIKRSNALGVTKQNVSSTKGLSKVSMSSPSGTQKTIIKPKIQVQMQGSLGEDNAASDLETGIKRKREQEEDGL